MHGRIGRLSGCVLAVAASVALAATPAFSQSGEEDRVIMSGSVGAGARAFGMGGAFIAVADDATAASWNPAGLCVLERPEASVVWLPWSGQKLNASPYSYTNSTKYYNPPGTLRSESLSTGSYPAILRNYPTRSLDFASVTYPFRLGRVKLVPQFHYQRVFQLGVSLDPYSYTAQTASQAISGTAVPYTTTLAVRGDRDGSGGLDVLTASLGVRLSSKVYVGVAVNRWSRGSDETTRSTNDYNYDYPTQSSSSYRYHSESTSTASQRFKGTSASLGLLVKPVEKFRLGAVYKSGWTADSTRTALNTSNSRYDWVGRWQESSSSSTSASTGTFKFPRTLGFGMAFVPKDYLTVAADYTTTRWSGAERTETLTDFVSTISYTYSDRSPTTVTGFNSQLGIPVTSQWPVFRDKSLPVSVTNPPQGDTQQLRLGAEFIIRSPGFLKLTVLPIRAGVFSDRQFFKNLPDFSNVDFTGLTLGFGLVWKRLSVDVAWVRTSGAYDPVTRDYTTTTDGPSYHYDYHYTYKMDGQVHYTANKLYVSTIVRF